MSGNPFEFGQLTSSVGPIAVSPALSGNPTAKEAGPSPLGSGPAFILLSDNLGANLDLCLVLDLKLDLYLIQARIGIRIRIWIRAWTRGTRIRIRTYAQLLLIIQTAVPSIPPITRKRLQLDSGMATGSSRTVTMAVTSRVVAGSD